MLPALIIIGGALLFSQLGKVVALLIWKKEKIEKIKDSKEYKTSINNFGVGAFVAVLTFGAMIGSRDSSTSGAVALVCMMGVLICFLTMNKIKKIIDALEEAEQKEHDTEK